MRIATLPIPDGSTAKKLLAKAAIIAILIYLAYLVREIWLPLALAFLLAMVLDPVVDRMEMRGWTRGAASVFIFLSFLVVFVGLIVLACPFAIGQWGTMEKGFSNYFPDPSHAGLLKSFKGMGFPTTLANGGVSAIENVRNGLTRSSGWITQYGMAIVSNAIWIVIVPIVAFYTLRDFHLILAKGLLMVPSNRRDLVQTAVTEITGVFGKYLRGLAIVSALNGIATGLLLWAIGVPGSLVLGVIAGLLYSVPYLGALITIVLTAFVAFVGGGPHLVLVSVGLSIVLHQVLFDQLITPRILGHHVGLHPLLSIIALLIGNMLLGIVGMILAVPVAACIQIAVVAVMPKLSQEIEIDHSGDSVSAIAKDIQETDVKVDATQEIHAAVSNAVESIEQQISETEEDS